MRRRHEALIEKDRALRGFVLDRLAEGCLSSDARCNTPRRFGIGRIETSGSVAMRGYSHLSDDEREQIGLLKVLGHSIGAIARAIRRPKSTISRELSRNRLPSGRYSPLHAAGAYQLRRRREALIEKDRALRGFVLDRLAEGCLSSDARCNTPRRFGIGRIETSGSVAMRGYSHLSDDEREQIGAEGPGPFDRRHRSGDPPSEVDDLTRTVAQ